LEDPSPSPSQPGLLHYGRALGLVTKPFPGLWAFAGLLALAVLAQMILAGLLFSVLPKKNALVLGIVALAASLLWIVVSYGAIHIKGLDPVRAFRISRPNVSRPYLFIGLSFLLGALIVLPSGFLYELVARHLSHRSQDLLDLVGKGKPTVGAIAFLVTAVALAAPLGEELFFRGFSFSGMKESYGVVPAAFSVSVMFAVIHFDPAKMLSIFFLSLVLCALVDWSGSVWPAVAAHAGYNGLQVAAWTGSWVHGKVSSGNSEQLTLGPVLVSLLLAAGLFYHLYHAAGSDKTRQRGPIGG